ncbi:hypothetical protein J4E83_007230 [Alternaria metachromatica]|uniref:uncharacterized protein n=1 Tax=Alternaria metachromatica TaxID=283354 RepID=UPI0020C39A6C|nr:uncharacterized protein J4E83_007230 [Alternaria metachromatica]KAI4614576.1 hypothetical protein J4E83_007230 [Alternaria metachromatica]
MTVNGKKSPKRMNSLETCVASQRRPPDIIAIQDPPPKFAFKSFGSYGHWYRAADVGDERQELTRDDDPSTYPYRIPHDRNERPKKAVKDLCKVAFLVHNSLKGCRITEAKGKNRGLHATLHVTLRSGHTIAFHNVYNHYNSIDVAELGKSMMSTDKAHVMVGDLNLHHPDWAGDELEWHKVEKQAKLLVERFQDASMECLNDGGITYSRSADVDRYASVLDLVYVKDVLKDQAVYKILENIPGYLSDHRISSVSIDVNMERRTGIRYHWDATPKDEFEERVTELLQDIEIAGLDDADAVNSALKTIITQVLEPAIKELVPVTQLYQPEPKYRPKVSPDATKRTTDWRESMEKKAAGPRGIFNFAKQVHNWSVPRRLAYTPDFKVGTETFHHNHEKADKYVECTWPSSRLKGPPLKPTFEQDSDRPEFVRIRCIPQSSTSNHRLTLA